MAEPPASRWSRWAGSKTTYHPAPPRLPRSYLPGRSAPEHGGLVQIRRGPGAGEATHLPPDRGLRIGRDRHAGLRLNHRSVSRRHAEIHPEAGGFVLTDTGSVNGTYLDHAGIQTPVTHARLTEGDTIILGVFALTYHGPP